MTHRILLIGLFGLALSGCGGNASAPADSAAPADSKASGQTGAMTEPVVLTIDTESMSDADCHVMDNALMGKCDEAGIGKAIGAAEMIKMNTTTMTDQACHFMAGEIMGKCSPDEVSSLRMKHTVLVDKRSMADQACHAMGNTIMGKCSPDDIKTQAAAIAATW